MGVGFTAKAADLGDWVSEASLTQPREDTRRWAAHIVDESPTEQKPRRVCLRMNEEA